MEDQKKAVDMVWFFKARSEVGKELSLLLKAKMLMVLFRKGLSGFQC